jgi:hypothetical protein
MKNPACEGGIFYFSFELAAGTVSIAWPTFAGWLFGKYRVIVTLPTLGQFGYLRNIHPSISLGSVTLTGVFLYLAGAIRASPRLLPSGDAC